MGRAHEFLKKTYNKLFEEFLKESSLHGLKIFLYHVSLAYAKKLWLILIIVVFIWTHYIIVNLTIEFTQQPTEIRMSPNLVHIWKSPFPVIAFCSANKISKRKLLKYAETIFNAQQAYEGEPLGDSINEIAIQISNLAGFYIYPYDNYDNKEQDLGKLHEILSNMYNNTNYPTRDILTDLSPDCENLVIRALIFGVPMNTSDLFAKRITSTGVCCMFNYRRESYSTSADKRDEANTFIQRTEAIKFEANSILNSIHFVVQDDLQDFVYKTLLNEAFQVNIFPENDYATVQSNTNGEILVEYNTIVEIPIQPRFIASSNKIRIFSPKLRNCYFPEEGRSLLHSEYYSLDECLMICRMESMLKYCGCVSPPMVATTSNVSLCSLVDLPCLTKWKYIWYRWNDFDYVDANMNTPDDGYFAFEGCGQCLPTCDDVQYKIFPTSMPLRRAFNNKYARGLLKGLTNDKPLAIVKLYFKQKYVQETVEDIIASWVLLLNRFGGIMSLMYGFSIITYIEIFYYLSGKWFLFIFKALKLKIQKSVVPIKAKVERIQNKYEQELYWDELKPKKVIVRRNRKNYF